MFLHSLQTLADSAQGRLDYFRNMEDESKEQDHISSTTVNSANSIGNQFVSTQLVSFPVCFSLYELWGAGKLIRDCLQKQIIRTLSIVFYRTLNKLLRSLCFQEFVYFQCVDSSVTFMYSFYLFISMFIFSPIFNAIHLFIKIKRYPYILERRSHTSFALSIQLNVLAHMVNDSLSVS